MKKDYSLEIIVQPGTDARYIYRGGILVAFAAPAGVSAYRAVAGVWYTNGELKEESFDNQFENFCISLSFSLLYI